MTQFIKVTVCIGAFLYGMQYAMPWAADQLPDRGAL